MPPSVIVQNILKLMNILPKQYSQFKQKQYWDHFFKELQDKQNSFDWYGTLQTYRQPLFFALNALYNLNSKEKHIEIAHLGCGNSTLPEDILKTYPIFDFHIDNFDYSEAVIAEMQQKTKQHKYSSQLEFKVCDLLKPVEGQLQGKYDLIIDKGTLDAILPEDKEQNVKEIKQIYFDNAINMLNPKKCTSYVIMSMLQQFVLRTILQKFQTHPHFTIHILECALENSQLQPFFVNLAYTPQPHPPEPVRITLLTKSTVVLQTSEAVQEKIAELQQLAMFTGNVKQLRPGQICKFNLYSPKTNSPRYMLDIIDSSDESLLLKNTCSVFIVPPGMEAHFVGEFTLKQLQKQVSSSRLIVVKLTVGQQVKQMQELKEELNSVLGNLIQKGCKINEVPYLTDGTFEERQYLYRDQQIFVEQIIHNGQSYRRLILKNSPSLVQSQFRLTYVAEKNHPELKDVPSLTLPHKKGLLPGIDPHYLDQGYCRIIVAGLQRMLQRGLNNSQGLHLGGGAATIPKFLYHQYPQLKSVIVETSKSVVANCAKLFEWPGQDPRFSMINKEALNFIGTSPADLLFDFIIVDISNDEQREQTYPPKQFTDEQFILKCLNRLNQGGILIYNTISLNSAEKNQTFADLLFSFKEISSVYQSTASLENVVYFAVKKQSAEEQREGTKVIVAKNAVKTSKHVEFEWQEECLKEISMVLPREGEKFKQTDLRVVVQEDKKKKKKKK